MRVDSCMIWKFHNALGFRKEPAHTWKELIMCKSKLIVRSILVLLASSVVANAADVKVSSEISEVTVYPNGARVTRVGTVTLDSGEHSLLFSDIPIGADQQSIRSSAYGVKNAMLLGLKHRIEYLSKSPLKQVADLQRQIHELESQDADSISDRLEVFKELKTLLTNITRGSGGEMNNQLSEGRLDVTQWEAAYNFAKEHLLAVNDTIRTIGNALKQKSALLDRYRTQLRNLQSNQSRQVRVVQVDVLLDEPGELTVSLDYVIDGATWTPLYDARAVDTSEAIGLRYYADISQHTGENWKNVNLTLSTSSPSGGFGPGEFVAWVLKGYRGGRLGETEDAVKVFAEAPVIDKFDVSSSVRVRGGRAGEVATTVDDLLQSIVDSRSSVATTSFTTSFKVARAESIPSGSETIRTLIGEWKLDSKKTFLSRPRDHEGVYRQAKVVNTTGAPLLPGMVSIFSDADFLGSNMMRRFITPGEEFTLPFGRDSRLPIKREILTHNENRKGSTYKINRTIKITLTNHSEVERVIDLEESLPVSADSRIKVKVGEITPPPVITEEKGKAEWKITLAPNEEVVVMIPYRIEYPRGMVVHGL